MRKEFYLLFVLVLALTSCNSDVSKTHWATMVKEVNSDSELKMVVLLEGDLVKIDRCCVLAKITDKNKIQEIYNALDDARYFCRSYDSFTPKANQKAICFIDTDNMGHIIRIEWDIKEKKVRFAPMPEYIGCRGKLKKVVFIEGNRFGEMKGWHKLYEVTGPKELDKIKEAFSTAKYCEMHILETSLHEIAMVFICEDGQDEILAIDLNKKDQIVEFKGGYSDKLYNILTAYGI